jgi:hypothetical protein
MYLDDGENEHGRRQQCEIIPAVHVSCIASMQKELHNKRS